MKAVIDTRFLMESIESKEVVFRKWASGSIETLERQGNLGIIPSIVILEFYKIQMEKWGRDTAEARVSSLLKLNLKIADLNVAIAVEAAKLRCRYGEIPTADAVIAATAILTCADCILTDDKHIRQVKETKTKWI